MAIKQIYNNFYIGIESELPANLPSGSRFLAEDTKKLFGYDQNQEAFLINLPPEENPTHTSNLTNDGTDGTNPFITALDLPNVTEYTLSPISGSNTLDLLKDGVSVSQIDLTPYVDDTNLARIISGVVDPTTGLATITRDDATIFTINFSSLIDVQPTKTSELTNDGTDGTNPFITALDLPNVTEYTLSPISGSNTLDLLKDGVSVSQIDLTQYVDDTNLARIVSGVVNPVTGIATITRDDSSTFTIDFSSLIDVQPTKTSELTNDGTDGTNPFITANDVITGLENVAEDVTPQLGGDLDVNGKNIVSTSNGDINLLPDGTGNVGVGTVGSAVTLDVNGQFFARESAGGSLPISAGKGIKIEYSDATDRGNILAYDYSALISKPLAIQGAGGNTYLNPVNGNVGIGTTTPTEKLEVNGNIKATQYDITSLHTAPTSSTDNGTTGEIRYTEDYIYVCTATNTWKRSALTSW